MRQQSSIILLLSLLSISLIHIALSASAAGGEYEWATIHLKVYAINQEDLLEPEEILKLLNRLVEINHDPYDEGLAKALIGASELSETKCTQRAFNKLTSIIKHFSNPILYHNVVRYLNNSQESQKNFCKEKLKHVPVY